MTTSELAPKKRIAMQVGRRPIPLIAFRHGHTSSIAIGIFVNELVDA
jgi:hypothetical protein